MSYECHEMRKKMQRHIMKETSPLLLVSIAYTAPRIMLNLTILTEK